MKITATDMEAFEKDLFFREKAKATVDKYSSIIRDLANWLGGRELDKELLLSYRDELLKTRKVQTVNGFLSAINAYLEFVDQKDMRVHFVKVQRAAFIEENKELTQAEYKRLLETAKARGNERLYLLMMTIGSTGIRVSELMHITVNAARQGRAHIYMKGKSRTVLMPKELCKKLLDYCRRSHISEGQIFCTRSGRPLDRTNICHDMKKLCREAKVNEHKVFPHNLRHLFARSFYAIEKNLAHLADVLGHTRIETTRIYVAVSAATHEKTLKKMRLVI